MQKVNFPNFQKAQNASHQSITTVKWGPESVLWSQKPLRSALSTQCWSDCHRLRLCWFLYNHFTRYWLNNPNLDPYPGLWWVLAVINVRADNLSQKQFLPLSTNSESNQTSPWTWIKLKNIVVGGTLIYTFLFLNPNPFRVLDPYMQKG